MTTHLPANDGLPYGMRWEHFGLNSFEVLDSENLLIAQVCAPYGSIEDWAVYIAFPNDDGTREFRFLGRYHFDSIAIATVQTLLPYIW